MKFGIDAKFIFLALFLIMSSTGFLGWYSIKHEQKALNIELEERILSLMNNLAHNSEYGMLTQNKEELTHLADNILRQKDIIYVRIEDNQGIAFAEAGNVSEKISFREFSAPIMTAREHEMLEEEMILGIGEKLKEEEIGKVRLSVSLDSLQAKINEVKIANIIIASLIMGFVTIAIILMVRIFIASPINLLVSATQKIAMGDLNYRVQIGSKDEIGVLATFFNKMAEDLSRTLVSKNYVDNIIKSMVDTLIVVDPEAKIVTVNQATLDLLGYRESELIGKPLEIIFPGDEMMVPIDITGLTGEEYISNVERTYVAKDGRKIPVLFSGSVMRNKEGKLQGAVYVALDITRRKQMEEELRRKAGELERSNKELEQFAYVASHDLQEPLRMVASYLQLIVRRYQGKLDDTADEFIGYAVDGAERMRKMIDDLLTYSRVGTRGKPFEPTDCKEVLNQSIANLEIAIKESKAVVTCDSLPRVTADGSQMVQLFQNLIGNALKFTNDKPPRVFVSADRKGNEWVFSVRDDGIGIESQHIERIFQIFQRLHGAGKYPGTGIGLAVCRRIVERHGGRIWVESEPGNGATFYFTIPIKD
jgi:PAS domain S-box-containing protein